MSLVYEWGIVVCLTQFDYPEERLKRKLLGPSVFLQLVIPTNSNRFDSYFIVVLPMFLQVDTDLTQLGFLQKLHVSKQFVFPMFPIMQHHQISIWDHLRRHFSLKPTPGTMQEAGVGTCPS